MGKNPLKRIDKKKEEFFACCLFLKMATGRGRARPRKQELLAPKIETNVSDPYWSVSDSTTEQFFTENRPSKPSTSEDLGNTIKVIVNYFRVLKFPQQGFAYQYDIEIKTKNGRIPGRTRRRYRFIFIYFYLINVSSRIAYNIWLKSFLDKNPDFDKYRIVFDNDKIIFTYDQQLSNENIQENIKGFDQQDRRVEYGISIKRVRNPIDLSLIRSAKQLYENNVNNNSNISLDDLQSIRHILAVVLHEKCSSEADFIFSRSFFSQPTSPNSYGGWDLGLGKAAWSGFYSCPVVTKDSYPLSVNLDGKSLIEIDPI